MKENVKGKYSKYLIESNVNFHFNINNNLDIIVEITSKIDKLMKD